MKAYDSVASAEGRVRGELAALGYAMELAVVRYAMELAVLGYAMELAVLG